MSSGARDTKYLQEVIGEALSRGCAATVAAQPSDPVEYLGQWLLRYVKNAEIVGEFMKEKEAQLAARKAQLEEEAQKAAKAKELEETKRAVIMDLSTSTGEPRELLQKAVDLIKRFTTAGAAYAAAVAEPEEPDWVPPEDPEDPAAVESEDEPDPQPQAEGTPEDGDAAAAAEQAEAAPADGEEEGATEQSAPKIQRPVDYSKKYLSYMVATAGQEFLLSSELYRPAPPPEDDPEAKIDPPAFTFRVLDERRPMVYTPNVAFEPSIRFFRNFPKIGAYQACGVQSSGEFKVIIGADTLFPEGGGQALPQEDQDFIWSVSRALSMAYEAMEKKADEQVQGTSAAEVVEALKKRIHEIYFPPQPEGEAGDSASPAPASGSPVPPAAEEPAAEEGGDAAEGADGDDPVAVLKAEIKQLEQQLHEAEETREKAGQVLEVARNVHAVVNDAVLGMSEPAVQTLRNMPALPQATFHVLKAVLHVLGKQPEAFKNWKRAFAFFGPELFQELHDFDPTADRDEAAWKRARSCYKGVADPKKLETEMPNTQLGALLLMWLKQTRKVARRAAAFRAARKVEEDTHDQLDAKKVALEEAEKKKAEEEEAARKAAEEEAARQAAEAAAEGEEGGEEGEGDE